MIVLFVMTQGMDSVSQERDVSAFRMNGYLKQRHHIPLKLQSQCTINHTQGHYPKHHHSINTHHKSLKTYSNGSLFHKKWAYNY